jgi:hypothetical protein
MGLDLASFKSVQKFASEFLSKDWALDILINNGKSSIRLCIKLYLVEKLVSGPYFPLILHYYIFHDSLYAMFIYTFFLL